MAILALPISLSSVLFAVVPMKSVCCEGCGFEQFAISLNRN